MTITSKFNGKCKKCGGFIKAGQEIEWDKQNGPRHISCPAITSARASAGQSCPAQKSFTPVPKPSQQLREVGGRRSQQPFKPGSMPYRGKFQRLEQAYHQAEKAVATKSYRPRTTATISDKSMTRTL